MVAHQALKKRWKTAATEGKLRSQRKVGESSVVDSSEKPLFIAAKMSAGVKGESKPTVVTVAVYRVLVAKLMAGVKMAVLLAAS